MKIKPSLIVSQNKQALLAYITALVGFVEGIITAAASSSTAASYADSKMSSTSTYGLAYQAKNTLHQNMEPMSMTWNYGLFFSCHVNQRWSEGHGTKLVCPSQNHPGVKANAENNIAILRKDRKSSVKLSKGGRGSSNKGGSKRSYIGDNPEFGRMSKTQKSAFAANLVSNKGELE